MVLSKPGRIATVAGTLASAVAAALVMMAVAPGAVRADDCAGQCRAQHNKCRLDTKGSPSCDGALQACLQRCLTPHKK